MMKLALDERRSRAVAKVPWSGFGLINAFNAWKVSPHAGRVIAVDRDGAAQVLTTGLVWRSAVCAQVFVEAAVDLGRSLAAFGNGKKNGRRAVRFSSFKRKHRARLSFRLRN